MDLGNLLKHQDWMQALARKLVLDDATADDLIQDAWTAALKNPPSSESSARGWLATVVRNLSYRKYRDRERRLRRESRAARPELDSSDGSSVEEMTERLETQQRVIDAVVSLDEPLREVVLLRYYEELSSSEIGRRLNVPAGTIRARLQRAVEVLRSRLDSEYGDRRTWGFALLVLAAPSPSTVFAATAAGMSASKIATWTGIGILMNAPKLAASIVISFLLGLGYLLSDGLLGPEDRQDVASSEPPNEVAPRVEVSPDPSPRVAVTEEVDPNPGPEPAPSPDDSSRRVIGQVLDPDRRGLPGILVSLRDSDRNFATDEDGEFSLRVDSRDLPGLLKLRVQTPNPKPGDRSTEVPGWATIERDVFVQNVPADPSESIDVGVIVLQLAGALRGAVRVVGGQGPEAGEFSVEVGVPGKFAEARKTDRDGRFFVNGLPEGVVWLTPVSPLGVRGVTRRIDVVAGKVLEVDLSLTPRDPNLQIHGVLVDADGRPTEGYVYAKTGAEQVGVARTVNGEFAVPAPAGAEVTLEVLSFGGVPNVQFAGYRAGDRNVRLELPRRTLLQVECRFQDGTLVETPRFRWIQKGGTRRARVVGQDGQLWTLVVPGEESFLRVESDLAVSADFGPVSRDAAGEVLSLVLEKQRFDTLSITVVDKGQPVEGARVELHTLRPEAKRFLRNGLPVLTQDQLTGQATDTTGVVSLRFPAVLDPNQMVVAIVEKTGFARSMHDVTLGSDDSQTIQLTRGGTLQGRLSQPYTDPADDSRVRMVAITNGDGNIRVGTADENGDFEFLNLAPGGWRIRGYLPELVDASNTSESDRTEPEAVDFEIYEGETTRFDFEIPGFRMEIEVSVDSQPPGPWKSRVIQLHSMTIQKVSGPTLDREGRANLTMNMTGQAYVLLRGVGIDIRRPFDLRGQMEPWKLEYSRARIEGTSSLAPQTSIRHIFERGSLVIYTTFQVDDEGRFSALVPIGSGTLQPGNSQNGPESRF
ncbi:MAG: sigma-70 family RNA polymerase sigma factor, partial [Planctomycetota bacterium]